MERTMVVDLKVGQSLELDLREGEQLGLHPADGVGAIRFTLRAKDGRRARVVVQAHESVRVGRPSALTSDESA